MNPYKSIIGLIALTTIACSHTQLAPASAPGFTDADVAAVVVAGNNADISYANIALTKTLRDDVKRFAQMVLNDHTTGNQRAVELAKKLNIVPTDNEVSAALRDNASQTNAELEGKTGIDFEKAYIDNEVTYHQKMMNTFDTVLIPNAKNEELKALLIRVRPAVEAHYKHAAMLQAQYFAK